MGIKDVLINGAKHFKIELSEIQIEQFFKYMELVKEWNQKINLTAISDDLDFVNKHFIDSMSIAKSGLIKSGMKVIDVGTGAGFPGIPIKILFPDVNVVLLDSLNKRVNFLNLVVENLGLQGIETIHSRAEDGAKKKEFREMFDIATARAVANMGVLTEYCIPYVKKNGYFIALKGPSADEEIQSAKNAISTLGGKLREVIDIEIPNTALNHKLVVVHKVKNTPEKYPRPKATIDKNPII